MTGRRPVTIVGAFPPPLHGFALVNTAIAERLYAMHVDLVCLPTNPPPGLSTIAYHAAKLARAARAAHSLWHGGTQGGALLIGLDGGTGLYLNILELGIARRTFSEVFLYHHSSEAMTDWSPAVAQLVRVAGLNATHVMCSHEMARRFTSLYRPRGAIMVVDNAAYVSDAPQRAARNETGPLVIGFLGNLIRSKGVLDALATLEELQRGGLAARLIIAGPYVDPDVRDELLAAKRRLGDALEMLGPISPADRLAFFARVDVLMFPSRYPHETQSLVVPEAMAAGVPVIAVAHRFVAEVLEAMPDALIPADVPFAPAAAALLRTWAARPAELAQRSLAVRASFLDRKAWADAQFSAFAHELVSA